MVVTHNRGCASAGSFKGQFCGARASIYQKDNPQVLDLCRSNPCCSRVNCMSFSLLKLLTHLWLWPISLFVIICCVYIFPPIINLAKNVLFCFFFPKELVFHFIDNIWPAFIHFLSYFINVLLHLNHFLLLSFHVSFFTLLNWVLIYL